jgi:UDP-N-acetylglucosamine 2-epimerase (non-hydrolysing)
MRLLTVFGTRPEAIKLAPVLLALREEPLIESLVCVTGQHRELLDQALALFGIAPDRDLRLMEGGQGLNALAAAALAGIDAVIASTRPDRVLVQGDTTTAFAAAFAAFHRGIPVAHVEAGLRTYSPLAPWPEEANRRAIALVSDLHFAPTAAARDNLLAERLHGEVFVTGNSGIDALQLVVRRLSLDEAFRRAAEAELPPPDPSRRLLLVTGHRREALGPAFAGLCEALSELAVRDDVEIVFPLHPNPAFRAPAEAALARHPSVRLLPPLGPASFIRQMQRADLILTDSGGVQEEAVALGKPVLVSRDVTERAEGICTRAARIVGTDPQRLVRELSLLLDDPDTNSRFPQHRNVYGDGRAAFRIVAALVGRPFDEFAPAMPDGPLPRVTAAAE